MKDLIEKLEHGLMVCEAANTRLLNLTAEDGKRILQTLKAQDEPARVLTMTDIFMAHNKEVWLEERNDKRTHPLMLIGSETSSKNKVTYFWPSVLRPIEAYGKTYRCWTKEPTEEERKAVKWDD